MTVEQNWRYITDGEYQRRRTNGDIIAIPHPTRAGWLVPDTRLQVIFDARESATTLAIEWFADAGLLSDFDEIMAEDVENLMGHVYAALGIEDALTEENKT